MLSLSRRVPLARPARRGLLARLFGLAALRRQRGRLAALDDHLLADIGVTRDQALQEAARPAWDAPAHWRA